MAVQIESLAMIGDRQTLAMVTKEGTICWYCPGRFDRPSLFASLLDEEKGGEWKIRWKGSAYASRDYEGDSAILKSVYSKDQEINVVVDFMPAGEGMPHGICRLLEGSSSACHIELRPAPSYGQEAPALKQESDCISIGDSCFFYSSHGAKIVDNHIELDTSSLKRAWMFLSDTRLAEAPNPTKWLDATRQFWKKVAGRFSYYGPYESEVAQSIRALRMLTHETNGGIIAAGTTSLPEVPGGERNYDYRYVWLRDAGMIVSALTRAGSNGFEEKRFLGFISGLEQIEGILFSPMYDLDQKLIPDKKEIELSGYLDSQPVTIGNGARRQLQLGTTANVLLAAKLIYNKYDTNEHWDVIAKTADFLAENWHREDKGIWEENPNKHYTTSKVITAVGLKYIAEHSDDEKQKLRWKQAEQEIREFVKNNCINSEGAYAAAAGEEAVDISAILFPTWGFTDIDAPEVLATVKVLERDYRKGDLYRRHLFEFDSSQEGAFLAASLWMAQYYVYRGNLDKARVIINEVLKYTTDLGFFSEEADVENERMTGNIPQTFVHASFIGAVIDLKNETEKQGRKTSPSEGDQ
jgi:GH15 family glucan-1,4-alpha-glucosidase